MTDVSTHQTSKNYHYATVTSLAHLIMCLKFNDLFRKGKMMNSEDLAKLRGYSRAEKPSGILGPQQIH